MADTGERITVTKVTTERLGLTSQGYRVHFSGPVLLRDLGARHTWWAELYGSKSDELGAYLWGLNVIDAHYERIQKEQTNGA